MNSILNNRLSLKHLLVNDARDIYLAIRNDWDRGLTCNSPINLLSAGWPFLRNVRPTGLTD